MLPLLTLVYDPTQKMSGLCTSQIFSDKSMQFSDSRSLTNGITLNFKST